MKKSFYIFFVVIICLSVFSCKKEKEETIVFDQSYPLSLAPDVEWALITDPYAAYKSSMDWNAEIVDHCRRGEILQVIGKSTDEENINWYRFENGWLPQTCLTIYTNRYKAQTVANNLKE